MHLFYCNLTTHNIDIVLTNFKINYSNLRFLYLEKKPRRKICLENNLRLNCEMNNF